MSTLDATHSQSNYVAHAENTQKRGQEHHYAHEGWAMRVMHEFDREFRPRPMHMSVNTRKR